MDALNISKLGFINNKIPIIIIRIKQTKYEYLIYFSSDILKSNKINKKIKVNHRKTGFS